MEGKLYDSPVNMIVDTAAMITLVNEKLMPGNIQHAEIVTLRGLGDQDVIGKIVENNLLDIDGIKIPWDVCVVPLPDDIILGLDLLDDLDAIINLGVPALTIRNRTIKASFTAGSKTGATIQKVYIRRAVTIPPNSEMVLTIDTNQSSNKEFILEPSVLTNGILISHVVGKGKRCQINLINDGNRFAKIKKGTPIGFIEEIDSIDDFLSDTEPPLDIKRGIIDSDNMVPPAPLQEDRDLPPHLTDLYQRSIGYLNFTEQKQLKHVLLEYQDVFACHDLDLGCLTTVKHRIDTKDSAPVKHRMRRTPIGFQDLEQQHLTKMLEAGVIQPSTSEWASAPVLVRKKDGTVRWCIDYRALNDRTIKDCFPLPIIEDCLDSLQGTTTFSTLDLASGYYQIELEPSDRKKTAFITKYGLFEHTRMGMGLCNAPATFQRAMQLVLRGLTWTQVLVYLDDVVVLGCGFEDGLRNLKAALDRFRKHTLKLKPKKCQLFQPEVEFLGKLVNANGISIAPSKIEAVRNWPVPSSKKEVMSYLGFLNYHRDHIDKFAETTACLYKLAHQLCEVEWLPVHEEAFQKSKTALLSAPRLTYPTPYDKFVLDTDLSDTCKGAVLSKLQDGREWVICQPCSTVTSKAILHNKESAPWSCQILLPFSPLFVRMAFRFTYGPQQSSVAHVG